jgi:hypothetical protein
VIIDAYQHLFQNTGWEAIATAGLSNFCTLLPERSQLALPRLVTEASLPTLRSWTAATSSTTSSSTCTSCANSCVPAG